MAQRTVSGNMLQGGSGSLSFQPAAPLTSFQPAAPAISVQPAATSQFYQPAGTGRMLQPAANVSGAMAPAPMPTGPTPEQLVKQEADRIAAEQATQISNLKKNVQNLVGNAMGVYESLYGNLGSAAASQKKQLEEQFGQQESEMQQQFSQELPRIGTAYAGRGAYDSSWRINAEGAARDQMLNQLRALGMEREDQMSLLGKSVMEQEAQFKAGQDALNRTLGELAGINDIEKLTAIQSDIQQRISNLEQSKAGLQSQEAFMQKFQQIGGPSSRTGQVKTIVDNILGGPADPELKQRVAAGFIQTSGLSPEEQTMLIEYLNTSIDRLTGVATPTTPTEPTVPTEPAMA